MSRNPTIPPWSLETEQVALGLLLLSQEPPAWLTEQHFFGGWHPVICRAVLALRKRRADKLLSRTVALLKRKGLLWFPDCGGSADRHGSPMLSEAELEGLCCTAIAHARLSHRFGWPLPWDELRDLADQRRILAAADRAVVMLRAGKWDASEAREALKEAM